MAQCSALERLFTKGMAGMTRSMAYILHVLDWLVHGTLNCDPTAFETNSSAKSDHDDG
jgi:hypothetical protein